MVVGPKDASGITSQAFALWSLFCISSLLGEPSSIALKQFTQNLITRKTGTQDSSVNSETPLKQCLKLRKKLAKEKRP